MTTPDEGAAPLSRPQHALSEEPPTHPEPVFLARGLCLPGREGPVFGPVDWDLWPGGPGVITGQQGSGRSTMLLALAGRLKGVAGTLQVGAADGAAHPRALRKQVTVGRISGLAELEPNLTLAESRDERSITDGIRVRAGRERFAELSELLDHRFDLDQRTERLPAVEATLFTLVLSCLAPARCVVVDDLDARLTDAQLRWIHDALQLLQAQGNQFVVTQLDESPLPAGAQVLNLAPPHDPEAMHPPVLHRLGRRRLERSMRDTEPVPSNPSEDA